MEPISLGPRQALGTSAFSRLAQVLLCPRWPWKFEAKWGLCSERRRMAGWLEWAVRKPRSQSLVKCPADCRLMSLLSRSKSVEPLPVDWAAMGLAGESCNKSSCGYAGPPGTPDRYEAERRGDALHPRQPALPEAAFRLGPPQMSCRPKSAH